MRVVILGCGYVGLELGRQLTADGHDVVGVRRSADGAEAVEEAGFDSVRADVTDADSLAAVPDADALVFAASAGRGGAEAARAVYLDGLETALDEFGGREAPPDRLLYASSTAVYGDHGGDWVDEETPLAPAGERAAVLAEAERRARSGAIDGTVVRFGGLYGPTRYRLERYLDGPVTEGVLNMIHRDDAAGVIRFLLTADRARDGVVLAVDDEPVEKWAFADWLADRCGVDRPPKRTLAERLAADDPSESRARRLAANKRCSNRTLRSLGYEFAYPTHREGYEAAIRALRGSEDRDFQRRGA